MKVFISIGSMETEIAFPLKKEEVFFFLMLLILSTVLQEKREALAAH